MPTSLLFQNNQVAIAAIRAVGAKQLILAPGNGTQISTKVAHCLRKALHVNRKLIECSGYTGGHYWTTEEQGDEPSSDYMYKLVDPVKNLAIDIHEYLDVDFRCGSMHTLPSIPAQITNNIIPDAAVAIRLAINHMPRPLAHLLLG